MFHIIHYLPLLGIIFATFCGIVTFRKNHPLFSLGLAHLTFALLAEMYSLITAGEGASNLWALNLYTIEEHLFLSGIVILHFSAPAYKRTVVFTSIGFIVGFVVAWICGSELSENGFPRGVSAGLLVWFALLSLYEQVVSKNAEKRLTSLNLFSFSIMVYFGSSFISFLSVNSLLKFYPTDTINWIWTIHLFTCATFYILFGISFLKYKRRAL